jgi:uncharacterized protein YjbI with pentapeptide repeats
VPNPEHLAKLKEGVNAWNDWRNENPDVAIDLTGADLSKASLTRANLAGADLHWANLTEATLEGADLRLANLVLAHLENADLRGADFGKANLRMALLHAADLEMADLSETATPSLAGLTSHTLTLSRQISLVQLWSGRTSLRLKSRAPSGVIPICPVPWA